MRELVEGLKGLLGLKMLFERGGRISATGDKGSHTENIWP